MEDPFENEPPEVVPSNLEPKLGSSARPWFRTGALIGGLVFTFLWVCRYVG